MAAAANLLQQATGSRVGGGAAVTIKGTGWYEPHDDDCSSASPPFSMTHSSQRSHTNGARCSRCYRCCCCRRRSDNRPSLNFRGLLRIQAKCNTKARYKRVQHLAKDSVSISNGQTNQKLVLKKQPHNRMFNFRIFAIFELVRRMNCLFITARG
jgi:hypothetical protein